jgi:hypothetical protein
MQLPFRSEKEGGEKEKKQDAFHWGVLVYVRSGSDQEELEAWSER